ncbi:MAG: DegV family protein, partial [Turicibacter sp.]
MAVKIITDSTVDMPQFLIDQYDISVVSLNVVQNGKSTRDIELSNDTFYLEMANSKEMPTSSQPIMEEELQVFNNIVSKGDSVLAIFLSSGLSGTFSSSHIIKDMVLETYPDAKIELFDSQSTSMQMGYMVLQAAIAAADGKSLDEVLEVATEVRDHSRFVFTPETLDYLKKGGRIGEASALLGTILNIKPILTVVDGKVEVLSKVRTKKKAIAAIVEKLNEDLVDRSLGGITVHHINCPDEGKKLADYIEETLGI